MAKCLMPVQAWRLGSTGGKDPVSNARTDDGCLGCAGKLKQPAGAASMQKQSGSLAGLLCRCQAVAKPHA